MVGSGIRNVGSAQYWGSSESLRDYTRDSDRLLLPAWQDYYGDAAVGLCHGTYVVGPDEYWTVYNSMPPHGLAASNGPEIVPEAARRSTESLATYEHDHRRDRSAVGARGFGAIRVSRTPDRSRTNS
ncbi:protein of unknown function [Halobiforma haloterrestris]|uniref:Uncharacterized protein n=1 Tax=Natronobacterium haloterrestre TaxID=148448 RepID=A0A1I1EX90_NATHA|nr:protein of unknown function [Halobiforma haloterrestris]